MNKRNFVLAAFVFLFSVRCFATDKIRLVKDAYLNTKKYTVEQLVDAISYGVPEWNEDGNFVTADCYLLEYATKPTPRPVRFYFSVSNSGKVKYKSIYNFNNGRSGKSSIFYNWKNLTKNASRLIQRQQKIARIIQEVNEHIVFGVRGDVNGDGMANCQDFSFMFKLLWDKYSPNEKGDCELVGNTGIMHAFVRVRIPYGYDLWEYIEPQAKVGSFEMPDAWDFAYDARYNHYGENIYGYTYPKYWSGVEEKSRAQFSNYNSYLKAYAELGIERGSSDLSFYGDLCVCSQMGKGYAQMYIGLSNREYDIAGKALSLDMGIRVGTPFSFGNFALNVYGGFGIGWAFYDDDTTLFHYAPQVGANVVWSNLLFNAFYTFGVGKRKEGAFCFGVGWVF